MVDDQKLFTFYYDYLYQQWLVDTYGVVRFFFPDNISVREKKFREYINQQYSLSLNTFNLQFDDPTLQDQYFKEAEQTYTMHVLTNAHTGKLWAGLD